MTENAKFQYDDFVKKSSTKKREISWVDTRKKRVDEILSAYAGTCPEEALVSQEVWEFSITQYLRKSRKLAYQRKKLDEEKKKTEKKQNWKGLGKEPKDRWNSRGKKTELT